MGHRTPWPYEVSATQLSKHTQTTPSGPLFCLPIFVVFLFKITLIILFTRKKEFDFLQVCFDLIILSIFYHIKKSVNLLTVTELNHWVIHLVFFLNLIDFFLFCLHCVSFVVIVLVVISSTFASSNAPRYLLLQLQNMFRGKTSAQLHRKHPVFDTFVGSCGNYWIEVNSGHHTKLSILIRSMDNQVSDRFS